MDVILHIGAHRTATTRLQQAMVANAGQLGSVGVRAWGPEMTRSGLFDGLISSAERITPEVEGVGVASVGRIRAALEREEAAGTQTLIVSEENMLGTMEQNIREAKLYPEAFFRLSRFAPAFAARCTRVVLTVRATQDYWASALAYTVGAGEAVPGRAQLAQMARRQRGWRDVVRDVRRAFPRAEVVIAPFETSRGALNRFLAQAHGGMGVPALVQGDTRHNGSRTASRLHAIATRRGDRGASLIPGDQARWMPFDTKEITEMRAQFARDLAWFQQGLRGIWFADETEDQTPGAHPAVTGQGRGWTDDKVKRLGDARHS